MATQRYTPNATTETDSTTQNRRADATTISAGDGR